MAQDQELRVIIKEQEMHIKELKKNLDRLRNHSIFSLQKIRNDVMDELRRFDL